MAWSTSICHTYWTIELNATNGQNVDTSKNKRLSPLEDKSTCLTTWWIMHTRSIRRMGAKIARVSKSSNGNTSSPSIIPINNIKHYSSMPALTLNFGQCFWSSKIIPLWAWILHNLSKPTLFVVVSQVVSTLETLKNCWNFLRDSKFYTQNNQLCAFKIVLTLYLITPLPFSMPFNWPMNLWRRFVE